MSAPAVTGAQVARALRRAGCEPRIDGPEHVVLIRDRGVVARLPLRGTVHPGTLRALLRTLDVKPEQLEEYLAGPEGRHDV